MTNQPRLRVGIAGLGSAGRAPRGSADDAREAVRIVRAEVRSAQTGATVAL